MVFTTRFDGVQVVRWIARDLKWARAHGWQGRLVSGYRSPAHQIAVGTAYAHSLGKSVAEVYPNGLLASNHVKKGRYPAGAADVTDANGLDRVLARQGRSRRLHWGGPLIGDWVHFSATGR